MVVKIEKMNPGDYFRDNPIHARISSKMVLKERKSGEVLSVFKDGWVSMDDSMKWEDIRVRFKDGYETIGAIYGSTILEKIKEEG